jgi:CHAT domain-containing protein
LNEQRWVGENDILKQTQLEKKILQLVRELNEANKNSANYSEIQDELFSNKQELEHLKELIKINDPLYYQNFVDKKTITVEDVQKTILKDHQALVELFNGDSAVYILAIIQGKSYLQKINKNAFDTLSADFTKYLSHPDFLNANFNNYGKLSGQLYRLIFQDINLPAGRIIISPDGKYFPFEALVTNTQPLTYFLDNYAVSYTYSARYLLNSFNTSSSTSDQIFMGVAPLRFTGLSDLEGSDQSLNRIQNYFSGVTNYIGNKASKNNFLNEFYKYKVIQLYTHATDSGYASEPMIYFSDSALSLSDLLPEKKPATKLIVLSACETASGKLYSGEGVFSFNRSFAALGIPSSVSNLWQVDNKPTYRLTELFYKYLTDGMPLDLALQNAKKEFRRTTTLDEEKLPYYWAASILVGKADEISLQKRSKWVPIAAIAFLASIILGGWIMMRKKFFEAKRTETIVSCKIQKSP